jgi:hypothetical protein
MFSGIFPSNSTTSLNSCLFSFPRFGTKFALSNHMRFQTRAAGNEKGSGRIAPPKGNKAGGRNT